MDETKLPDISCAEILNILCSLYFIFGKALFRALDIIDHGNLCLLTAHPSNRQFYQVSSVHVVARSTVARRASGVGAKMNF